MAVGKCIYNWKRLENSMLRGYLVCKAHKNKIPTAVPMLSWLTFSMAIIFASPDVAVISEINTVWKWFQFGRRYSHFSDVRL